jgi:hypothetical protein
VALVNPLTRTAPLFRTHRDQEITLHLHRAGTWLAEDVASGWRVRQVLMFMVNAALTIHRNENELSETCRRVGARWEDAERTWLPLYEGKMVSMYDHRASTVVFDPRNRVRKNQAEYLSDEDHVDPNRSAIPMFWIRDDAVRARCGTSRDWFVAVKDVTGAGNERTCIAAALPLAALSDSVPWLRTDRPPLQETFLLANLNSFPCDFAARQKVAGLHLRGHYLAQLPVIQPARCTMACEWDTQIALQEWVAERVLELSFTAWDLEPFAISLNYKGPPFVWNPTRRTLLRCELDAAFFHLYGLSRDDVSYVMDTFPIVRKADEKAHGEYRTKRLILEIYDELAEAISTGKQYQTRLDPPPSDLRGAHPVRTKKPAA